MDLPARRARATPCSRRKQLLPDSDILVFAGPGVEYYTRLRHFSVGLEVTGSYLVSLGRSGSR